MTDLLHRRLVPTEIAAKQKVPPAMSLPPATAKRWISIEERRAMDAERAKAVRLRLLLDQELEVRGIRDPVEIGTLAEVPAVDAEKLLIRRRWRAGDLALLERMIARLGVSVPEA